MSGLIIDVGDLVDRIGRTPALAGGLLLMDARDQPAVDHERGGLVRRVVRARPGPELLLRRRDRRALDSTASDEQAALGFNDLLAGVTGAGLAVLTASPAALGVPPWRSAARRS